MILVNMPRLILTIAGNNNRRGFFTSYSEQERCLIAQKTFDWSVNYFSQLGLFDKIYCFADSDYMAVSVKNNLRTKVHLEPAGGKYFLRLNDTLLYNTEEGDRTSWLKNDDTVFATHMDAFFSKERLYEMAALSHKYYLVSAVNRYKHNCIPVAIDGKEVSWWSDHCMMFNVGWMKRYNLRFSWNPCYREVQDRYLKETGCTVSIKGKHFVTLDHPSKEYPSHGNGLSFDGFQEASLKIGICQRHGHMPISDICNIGDGQKCDREMVHLKSFFMQSPTTFRGIANNTIINTVILGRPPEKERIADSENEEYMHNTKQHLRELVGTSIYFDVWNAIERERFNSLLN